MQSRNYCFTLNNYTKEEEDEIKNWDRPKYIIFGYEMGEDKNTPHLQGYIEFRNVVKMTTLKNFNKRIHWELRRGTAQQAIDYCKKDGVIFEKGTPSRQGKRTDLENVANAILKKKTLKEVAYEFPREYIKFHSGIKALKQIVDEDNKEFREVKVNVYYGKTGTGKTKRATKNKDYFKLDCANNVWFDGYDGQPHLIIDDFYGWIKFGHLLNILDGHPLRLEIKGGFTYARWTKVTITSNKSPFEWYHELSDEQSAALKRRLTKIIHFN